MRNFLPDTAQSPLWTGRLGKCCSVIKTFALRLQFFSTQVKSVVLGWCLKCSHSASKQNMAVMSALSTMRSLRTKPPEFLWDAHNHILSPPHAGNKHHLISYPFAEVGQQLSLFMCICCYRPSEYVQIKFAMSSSRPVILFGQTNKSSKSSDLTPYIVITGLSSPSQQTTVLQSPLLLIAVGDNRKERSLWCRYSKGWAHTQL